MGHQGLVLLPLQGNERTITPADAKSLSYLRRFPDVTVPDRTGA